MKKIYLVLSSILLISCSSDNEGTNTPVDLTGKLKSTVDSEGVSNFLYYTNGNLQRTNMPHAYYAFIYENNKIIRDSIIFYDKGVNGYTYSYTQNLITESVSIGDNNKIKKKFFYDSSERLIKEIGSRRQNDNTFLDVAKIEFFYEGDNVVQTKETSFETGQYFIVSYEYDDKKNPKYDIYPSAYRKIWLIPKNNIIKRTSDYYGEQIYQYEYNVLGYPIKSISNEEVITFQYY